MRYKEQKEAVFQIKKKQNLKKPSRDLFTHRLMVTIIPHLIE